MQPSQDFFELSADFQNSGRETAPADLFLPWRCTFRKFLLAFVLSACALVPPSVGVGTIEATEYHRNSGRRFGLRGCRFQWLPRLPDTEHRFPDD